MTNAEYVAEQRAAILANDTLTDAERRYLLDWCDEGCPGDEDTDVGFEDGNFY